MHIDNDSNRASNSNARQIGIIQIFLILLIVSSFIGVADTTMKILSSSSQDQVQNKVYKIIGYKENILTIENIDPKRSRDRRKIDTTKYQWYADDHPIGTYCYFRQTEQGPVLMTRVVSKVAPDREWAENVPLHNYKNNMLQWIQIHSTF